MDHRLDQAIETSREGHAKFSQHAFLHLIAANAYEQQHRIAECVSELRTYLGEEPTGPRAEIVKNAITTLQAQIAQLSPR